MSRPMRVAMATLATALAVIFVGRAVAPDLALYRMLGDYALRWIASLVEVPLLVLGATHAWRTARVFGAGNPVSRAWALIASWLGLFALGQVAFSIYPLVLRRATPLPSAGDALYGAGYVMLIAGILAFQRAYARSGFAVGTTRGRTVLAVAVGVALVEGVLLTPVATLQASPLERALNVAYPVLDGIAMVALFVLARTVRVLRGGRAWRVWAAMLAAIAIGCAGDILFAYFFFHQLGRLESVVNLVFTASYAMAARGAYLQYDALRGPRVSST